MGNDLWKTPQYIFDWLDREFDFELDAACTTENSKCFSGNFVDKQINGLIVDWNILKKTNVYLNPPYSDPYPWVKKAYEESQKGCTVVCLLPADVSTKWFHEYVIGKAEIRFIQGRINFDNPIPGKYSSPKFGSMVVIYKKDIDPKVISVKRPDKPKEAIA